MHLSRTHRIDAAAISQQVTRGAVSLHCECTHNEAADVGTKRFTDPLAGVKVLYRVNIVTPKFWEVNRYQDYLASTSTDWRPSPGTGGGIPKPRIGPKAAARQGGAVPSKKMHGQKRVTKGKPATAAPIKKTAKIGR
eukprot:1180349-Pyramimonas_sp.AAC.1